MTTSQPPAWLGAALAAAQYQDSLTGLCLPCITLYLPWAYYVMRGWKPIETREHSRFAYLVGKTVGIHVAQKVDRFGYRSAAQWLEVEQLTEAMEAEEEGLKGFILGTVRVTEHRPLNVFDEPGALIECKTLRWGSFLRDVRPFQSPIEAKGHQGIWYHQL
jgi:hypothetical protein